MCIRKKHWSHCCTIAMACERAIKPHSACTSASKSFLVLLLAGMLCFLGLQRCGVTSGPQGSFEIGAEDGRKKYLYWGPGIDCPGKHCLQCGGLGHQESSLRCALEEALFLNRTFVLPSKMCISIKHSHVGLFGLTPHMINNETGTPQTQDCLLDTLYDLDLMSQTVPVISSTSREWQDVLKRDVDHVHVEGIKRDRLKKDSSFSHAPVINRTPNRLAWFTECKNRRNYSAIILPYSFLPSMANPLLRAAADNIKKQLVDYDALHVRRGDKLKVRKDRFGVLRAMYAHLDHDTQPDHIIKRIENLIPEGRTLYIATDEMQPHFFDKLSSKYRIMRACNFSEKLNPLIQNNYQLFVVERMVLLGARVLVKTWKEHADDISLSDEKKKKIQRWEPVMVTKLAAMTNLQWN